MAQTFGHHAVYQMLATGEVAVQYTTGQQDADHRNAVKILLTNQGSQQATVIFGRSRGQTQTAVLLVGQHPASQALAQHGPAPTTVGDQIGMFEAIMAVAMPLGPIGHLHQSRRTIGSQELQGISRLAVGSFFDVHDDQIDLVWPQALHLTHAGCNHTGHQHHNQHPAPRRAHHGIITAAVYRPPDWTPAKRSSR